MVLPFNWPGVLGALLSHGLPLLLRHARRLFRRPRPKPKLAVLVILVIRRER
jgi:hypothetical protein